VDAAIAANIAETQVEYVAEAWRRGEEEGFETEHELGEAMTDLATVRDAMEATDEVAARTEQEAEYEMLPPGAIRATPPHPAFSRTPSPS
jgi:flagellar biosynthesis/type III secretory pathway protein FliH